METCPGCGAKLRPMEACNCGHKRTEKTESPKQYFRCQYSLDGVRCSAPATITDSVRPNENRKWLCLPHWRTRGDPYGSQLVMDDYGKNGVPITKDWVEELMETRKGIRQQWFRSQNGKESEKDKGDLQGADVKPDGEGVVDPSRPDAEYTQASDPVGQQERHDGQRGDDGAADEPW